MDTHTEKPASRVLVIDDTEQIHDDFRKIFALSAEKDEIESKLDEDAKLFFTEEFHTQAPETVHGPVIHVDSAYQGEQGIKLVQEGYDKQRPYKLAFVDMRMPPGIDGLETIENLWKIDPQLQIVICTAYSDHSWPEIMARVGKRSNLLVLKKPFDTIEVQQMTSALLLQWEQQHTLQALQRELEEQKTSIDTPHEGLPPIVDRLQKSVKDITQRSLLVDPSSDQGIQFKEQLDDLKDYLSIVTGHPSDEKQPFDLASLCDEIRTNLVPDGIDLETTWISPSLSPSFVANKRWIRKIITAMIRDVCLRSQGYTVSVHFLHKELHSQNQDKIQDVEIRVTTPRMLVSSMHAEGLGLPDLLAIVLGGAIDFDQDGDRLLLPLEAHSPS